MKAHPFFSILIMLLFPAGALLQAQSTAPEVFGSAGNHSTNPSAQVSWTVGETVTQTLNGPAQTLTQGFHQTRLTITAIEDLLPDWRVEVFPNPAHSELNIRLDQVGKPYVIRLVDTWGQVVREIPENRDLYHSLDVSQFAQGPYYLQIGNAGSQDLKTYKIQIIHSK